MLLAAGTGSVQASGKFPERGCVSGIHTIQDMPHCLVKIMPTLKAVSIIFTVLRIINR